MTREPIIAVSDLKKAYGEVQAVAGVSFAVQPREIYGILGPNGAGKTTTLEILEGLRLPDSGKASIAGLDVVRKQRAVKEIIGVSLQTTGLHDNLTVEETLSMFRAFYKNGQSVDELITRVNLLEKRKARVSSLSGGQKQRLALALALVNDPEVIFLDEPTTGLDPQARLSIWETIEELRDAGKTIILTTHYMEEAERLCDRIAIMDGGKIIAEGTDKELLGMLDFSGTIEGPLNGLMEQLQELKKEETTVKIIFTEDRFYLHSKDLVESLRQVLGKFEQEAVKDLVVRRATLEDVFIALTGRVLRD